MCLMYITSIFLSSWICVIRAQNIFDKHSHGITSLLGYSIPGNTERVYFYDNSISHIAAGYFVNLPNLDKIWIWSNDISNIDNYAFAQVPSVKTIELGNNKLREIHKTMFAGAQNLQYLSLYNNEIDTKRE